MTQAFLMHFAVFCTQAAALFSCPSHICLPAVLSVWISVLFSHYGSVNCRLLITKASFVFLLCNWSTPLGRIESLQNLSALVLSDPVGGFWPYGSAADRLLPCFCKWMMGMFACCFSDQSLENTVHEQLISSVLPSVSLLFLLYQVVCFDSIFPLPCWTKKTHKKNSGHTVWYILAGWLLVQGGLLSQPLARPVVSGHLFTAMFTPEWECSHC